MEGMPIGRKNRHAACILCQGLSQFLFPDWISGSLEKICQVLCPAAKVLQTQPGAKTYRSEIIVNLSKEVNQFVGLAISDLIKKTRKQLKRSIGLPKMVDEKDLIGRLELLKSMQVFEHKILDHEEYINTFYCPFHHLLNDGFLVLVSPKYIGLGSLLLQTFAEAMNENKLKEKGYEILKKVVEWFQG
jgi:hypothetical protein